MSIKMQMEAGNSGPGNSRDLTMQRRTAFFTVFSAFAAGMSRVNGDEQRSFEQSDGIIEEDTMADPAAEPQPGMMTLGGRQFWGDVFFLRGYRIQQNVFTGHHRLLDANDRRYASGTLEQCHATLKAIREAKGLQPDSGHVVIFLHGLGRSSKSLSPIMKGLKDKSLTPVPFEYPSTRVSLADCAAYLSRVIASLDHAERISFVVHSMGGLVVRRYLQDHKDARHHRFVMMGTPNRGADLADMLHSNFLFKAVYGPAGQELVSKEDGTIASLPTPDFPFGVIAGGKGDEAGYNKILKGDNDGTVTVDSTRLDGASDFMVVPRLHSFLMNDPVVIEAVNCFLDTGRFRRS